MMRLVRVAATAALTLGALLGCTDTVTPDQRPPAAAPYAVHTLVATAAADERWLDGRVEGLEQATVTAQTAGEVLEVVRDVADEVAAAAVVLRLRATQQQSGLNQAEAMLREALARESEATVRYQRIVALYERKAVAKATLDEVTAQKESAVSRALAARAAVGAARETLGYTVARAPFAGVVTDRYVRVGSIVQPGMPLFAVSQTSALRIVSDIPEEFAEAIRRGGAVAVEHAGQRWNTRNVVVQPRVGVASGAVGLRVDLPEGASGLQPGMVVKLVLATGERSRLELPQAALVTRGEVNGVYVYDAASGRTAFRQLRVGRVTGEGVEVLAGLQAGEQVAVDPAAALRHLRAARSTQ